MGNRLTIFAGAGASKAVNPKEFPTTVEFFQRLPDDIKSDSLFQFAQTFIDEVEKPEQIDIEMILWALETLRSECDHIRSKSHITGRLFRSHPLLNEIIPRQNLGGFSDFIAGVKGKLDQLISRINQEVYGLYGYEPEEELRDNWLELLSRAEGARESLEIFTTNYDAVIEAALYIRLGAETAKEWRGVSGRVRPKLNLKEWAEIGARPATITKLHGSLDWRRAGKEIHVGDPNFTGDHKNHAIIYPGFKGQNSSEFFSIFHNYLSQAISESSMIIFIGFAFRDEYINSIIRENLPPSAEVILINPARVDFPTRRASVRQIQSGFDADAISSLRF